MSRTKAEHPETITERVALIIDYTGGTMPLSIVVDNEAEAAEATALLTRSKKPGAKLVSIKLNKDETVWRRDIERASHAKKKETLNDSTRNTTRLDPPTKPRRSPHTVP